MDDLISRAAAIDALGERPMLWVDDDAYTLGERNQYDLDKLAIETVPSAQPRWIPCSERLPEPGEYYLVTCRYFGWNCTEYRETNIAKYDFNGWHIAATVFAWCELPEPYKENTDG